MSKIETILEEFIKDLKTDLTELKTINNNILLKLDDTNDKMLVRIKNIEGWQANQDLAIEPEVTKGVKSLLEDYSRRNGFMFTFKTGKNYPANLREPTNNKKAITNIDGSYLITSDEKNSKYTNSEFPDKINENYQHEVIEQNVQKAMKILNKGEVSQSSKAIKVLKNAENKILSEIEYKKENARRRNILLEVQKTLETKDISIRELAIIEAKSFLKIEYVRDQAEKMMNLINYFSSVYLYYKAKEDGRLEEVRIYERWTKNFIELCEKYNMRFTGLILVLGGPSGIKNIYNEFSKMIGDFNREFSENKTELTAYIDNVDNEKAEYMKYKFKTELEFKLMIKTEFFLVTPGSYRFANEL